MDNNRLGIVAEINLESDQYGLYKKDKKKEGCKQVYDKVNSCTFCEKMIKSKISRHILTVHKDEQRVYNILLLPGRSERRMIELEFIANEGNFKHNAKVIKLQKGSIIVGRRDKGSYTPKDYLPWQYCKKFVLKKTLWHHNRNCRVKKILNRERGNDQSDEDKNEDGQFGKSAMCGSKSLLSGVLYDSEDENIAQCLDRMRDDEVKDTVLNDMSSSKGTQG